MRAQGDDGATPNDEKTMIVRMFQGLALLLAAAGIVCLIRGDTGTAFVTGVLAACAFFLSIRFTYRPRVHEPEIINDEPETDTPPDNTETTN